MEFKTFLNRILWDGIRSHHPVFLVVAKLTSIIVNSVVRLWESFCPVRFALYLSKSLCNCRNDKIGDTKKIEGHKGVFAFRLLYIPSKRLRDDDGWDSFLVGVKLVTVPASAADYVGLVFIQNILDRSTSAVQVLNV